jgi:hypothetical protein
MSIRTPLRGPLALGFATVLAATSACDDDEVDLDVVHGDHLDYAWEATLRPCAGTAAALDSLVPWVAGQLGLDLDGLARVSYTWLGPEGFIVVYNGSRPVAEVNGWAPDGEAIAREPALDHEVIHLVDYIAGGVREQHPLLTEGLAVAFDEKLPSQLDPRPVIDDGDTTALYPAGGSLVAYLLGLYGPEPLLELMEAVPGRASGERFREEFAAIYGRPLDEVVDDLLNSTICPEGALMLPLPRSCSAPTISWEDADTWTHARSLDCSADDVYGDEDGDAGSQVTLEVETPGAYVFTSYGDLWQSAALRPCGPCPWLGDRLVANSGERRHVELAAGRYSVTLRGRGDITTLAGAGLQRVDSSD